MAVRMRKVLARPWVGVRVCHLLFIVAGKIFNEQHWDLVNIVFMVAKLGNMFRKQQLCPGTDLSTPGKGKSGDP